MEPTDFMKMWFFLKAVEYARYGKEKPETEQEDIKVKIKRVQISGEKCHPCNTPLTSQNAGD